MNAELLKAVAAIAATVPGVPTVHPRKQLTWRKSEGLPFACVAHGRVNSQPLAFGGIVESVYPVRLAIFQPGDLDFRDPGRPIPWAKEIREALQDLKKWATVFPVLNVEAGPIDMWDTVALGQGLDIWVMDLSISVEERVSDGV